MIRLLDGPLAGQHVAAGLVRGDEVRIATQRIRRPISLSVGYVPCRPLPPPRMAVYRVTDSENATAAFVGWDDELMKLPNPLADAMANATDDEILELLNKVGRKRQ